MNKSPKLQLLLPVLALMLLNNAPGATYFVDIDGAGGNGLSWGAAFTNLQDALATVSAGDEIRVAKGAYYPTIDADRGATFQLVAGVSMLGGFTNGMLSADRRDWTNHVTRLSGDIGTPGDYTDDSYHIMTGADNVTIDGFVVAYGYADGASPGSLGAGIYSVSMSPTILNCGFDNNYASSAGAGIYCPSSSPTIRNCRFARNTSGNGGGIRFSYTSTALVENCSFLGNSGYGGGIYTYAGDCSPTIRNCLFVTNFVGIQGASIFNNLSSPLIEGCTFITNTATAGNSRNGAIYNTTASPVIRDCTFINNTTLYAGGAVIYSLNTSTVLVDSCRFLENVHIGISGNGVTTVTNCIFTSRFSGGVSCGGGRTDVRNCLFAGSTSGSGGGMGVGASSTTKVVNCVFSGCYAIAGNGKGGGIYNGGNLTVENCTFSGTRSLYSGYDGIYNLGGAISLVTNCIFWGNQAVREIYNLAAATSVVAYSDLEGSIVGGTQIDMGGNTNVNPAYADSCEGKWTSDAVYTETNGTTVLTDANTNWAPGALVGKYVNPEMWQVRRHLIMTNTANTITVWGCAALGRYKSTDPFLPIATNGAQYTIYDYHLKSKYGRHSAQGWIKDLTNSPCIDTGDPNSEWMFEAGYNGKRVNMGSYGNTDQGSRSCAPGTLVTTW